MQQIEKEYCHSIRSCDTIIMNLICRTCMQNHKQYVSIFDYHQNGKMLSDMLVECATIKIQKDDGLPTYICNYCLERLTSTWDFRAMIIKTDSDLRNILEKSKTENVLQNSNLFTDATVVKEESVIFNSEITSSLIQKNVITNNSNREECSQELITSSNDNNLATFSEHKTKGEIDKLLLKNNLDKSSHNLANEDNTISETSIKRVANNCTKRKRITSKHGQQIENEMNIDRKVKRSITSKLLSPGDSNDTENLESKKRENKNTKYIQEIEKHVTEEQDIIQDSCNINNTITCEDEDKIILEDNSQCHSDDESINNFDISNENVAETQLNSENVYKNFTRTEREKMSVFCKTCNRSFGYRYYFEVHVKLHSGDKKCKCDICGQSFVRQFQLRLHMTKHSDERPYSCETCGKTFKTYGAVYSHRAVHSDGTLFTCDICQKSFKSSSALKGHIRRHTSEKKYTCEVCGKSFSDSGCFSKHKLIHVDEKKFSCQTCGKTFSTKPGMRRHLRLHTAARRHACSYCDKSFKTKDVLDAHILIHTGEKPYSCKVCDKSFRQSAALFNHMRIHTGETPYACEHCPSQFKYSHHLQNHMKVHK